MDPFQGGNIRLGCRGRFDMRDEMRSVRITGFGQVNFVSNPGTAALFAIPGIWIIGGDKNALTGGQIATSTPMYLVSILVKLVDPGTTQKFDFCLLANFSRGIWSIDVDEQIEAVTTDLFAESKPLSFFLGQAIIVKGTSVALEPIRRGKALEPIRGH